MFVQIGVVLMTTFSCLISFGQRGPGGVSLEVPGNSNCKMWCDAAELSLSDGDGVSSWPDISLSVNVNTPTQANVASQPVYRSSPAETINGNPVLRFLPAQYLQLLTSNDINNAGPYTERTTFLAFRTGTDISTRQMLWEQGGGVRGLNIFISNDSLYFGGYDVIATDPDGTPLWDYTYTRVQIDPSTPYVVTHVFDGPQGAITGTISGFLNGQNFQVLNPGVGEGNPAPNVGSLWTHPDAPGLGAVNGDSYNELGPINGQTGGQPFLGDMAEFIAYSEILNDAERVIIENYLGAKYFANLIVNDFYDWQATHGLEVIGIGRFDSPTNIHNTSQARNVFQIDGPTAEFANANNEFFLVGHDGGSVASWTVTDAPNLGVRTLRIAREWKADHTGNCGDIRFTVDATAELPALPTNYTKLCLAIDKSGGAVSDFNSSNVELIEMTDLGGGIYETTEPIPDGSYITFAVVDPAIQFTNTNDFGFENTPVGNDNTVSVEVELNYRPVTDVSVDYNFSNVTAVAGAGPPPGVDYFNFVPLGGPITVSTGNYTTNITFDILGDSDPEGSEDLLLNLVLGAGTTAGLDLGINNQNTYTIFDDDNTPEVGFAITSSSQAESAGGINIQILRSGNTGPAVSVDYQLRVSGGAGTATDGTDYTYVSGTANFASGATSANMPVTILEDLLDEPGETVIFELYNPIGCDVLAAQKEHELTIADNDSPPEVCFVISTSQGPESSGNPSIEVRLSAPSTQICEIDYQNLLTGTASFPADYTIANSGTLTFVPGDTLEILPLFIINDPTPESDETINFSLDGTSAVNCTPGACLTHTYTIKDYSTFEWLGLAGVGMAVDNVFWLDANQLPDADGAAVQDFLDQSPNNQVITQATAGNRPTMNFNGPNNKKELVFNGGQVLDIQDDALINTNSFYTRKHITMAFTTGGNVTNRQMIYEQGGSTRGICMYIDGGLLYFHIWSNNDDNGTNSRWGGGSATGAYFVTGTVAINETYVVTLSYETDGGTGGTLEGFINGASVGTQALATVAGTQEPRLYSHGDNGGLGDVIGSTKYHDNTTASNPFTGSILELVHFSDAPYNTTRRIIVENHMAVKYDRPLAAGGQKYSNTFATTHENEIAGIGQFSSDDNHSDSKGTGMLRINSPNDLDVGDYLMWGHDGASLTMGLLPYIELIPNINNRLHRVWKASELGGDVGTVTLIWDLSVLTNFGSFVEDDLVLLIDNDDGDFSNATQIETGRTYSPVSGSLTFTDVNLSNDVWFTVGSKFSTFPLPIDLTKFTAKPIQDKVLLNWETASEMNNDFFTIEKSRNGLDFIELARVDGAGNSSANIHYEYTDENPFPGLSYYRLKQTDFDGQFKYSEIETVLINKFSLRLYPNPAKNEIFVEVPSIDNYQILVYDSGGRVMPLEMKKVGGVWEINTESLRSGLYYLSATSFNEKVIKKFVIQ